ncbi:MAG: hypothetical protein IT366_21905 [Candidatus Hydrogenedentes bacterium]|nr:hypothetical protein [Candidatus Hydrogenedentota bacterium]
MRDRAALRNAAKMFAAAVASISADKAPVSWGHAPMVLAKAGMFAALRNFLLRPKNFDAMIGVAGDVLSISAWCSGIAALIDHRPRHRHEWAKMMQPVMPRVLIMLETQYAPCGWLRSALRDFALSARWVNNESLLHVFNATAEPKSSDPSMRGGLALVQLMAETGEHDRAIELARILDAKYWSFDTAHFLALALLEKGRSGGEDAEISLREAVEIETVRSREVMAVQSKCFTLRNSVLARAHLALYKLLLHRGNAKGLEEQRRESMHKIETRFVESQNLQVKGYRSEIHFEIGEFETAWWTAADATDRSVASIEAGAVILNMSTTDPLQPRFVPYCRQQAIAWMLTHAPYAPDGVEARTETVIRWLLRERVWPMAIAVDAERAESLSPGISKRCADARRSAVRARIGTLGGLFDAAVDLWEFSPNDGPAFVVGIPQFDVYARGRNLEVAVNNLERILYLLTSESRYDSGRPLPIIAQLERWCAAHILNRPPDPDVLAQISRHYQSGHFASGLRMVRHTATDRNHYRPRDREEFDRLHCWLAAEAGDTFAADRAMDLFDMPTATVAHYTDLQKVGVALGLIPHRIVNEVHERFVSLRPGSLQRGFVALERFYWGLYLLGQEENSRAEEALSEALSLEIDGHNEHRVLARMGDALAEALRRRGDIPRALQILQENIAYREHANMSPAPSYVQRAKCQSTETDALRDLQTAQAIYEQHHPKDLIRALLIEARITSNAERQEEIYGTVLRTVPRFPGVRDDPKFQQIVERWGDWRCSSFSPELSYWGL